MIRKSDYSLDLFKMKAFFFVVRVVAKRGGILRGWAYRRGIG